MATSGPEEAKPTTASDESSDESSDGKRRSKPEAAGTWNRVEVKAFQHPTQTCPCMTQPCADANVETAGRYTSRSDTVGGTSTIYVLTAVGGGVRTSGVTRLLGSAAQRVVISFRPPNSTQTTRAPRAPKLQASESEGEG